MFEYLCQVLDMGYEWNWTPEGVWLFPVTSEYVFFLVSKQEIFILYIYVLDMKSYIIYIWSFNTFPFAKTHSI